MAILQRSNRSGGTVGFTRQLLIVFTVLSLVFGTPAPDSTDKAVSSTSTPKPTTVTTTTQPKMPTTQAPDDRTIHCLIIDDQIMDCDCSGLNFEEEILIHSLELTDSHQMLDQFKSQKQSINFLALKNCTMTNKTSEFTNTMYHLVSFEFVDCVNISVHLHDIMKRRFERDAGEKTFETDLATSLKIEYTKNTADIWPSKFSLISQDLCARADQSAFLENYNLHKLELINVPDLRDFDSCTIRYFPYLYHLDMSYSNFENHFPNISHWENLTYLRCRSCRMANIPTAEFLPNKIEVIDFSNNKIRNTNPCPFEASTDQKCYLNQQKLGHLDLSANDIMFIHYDIFKYSHLQVSLSYKPFGSTVLIDFNNNKFQFFPFEFFTELNRRRDENTAVIVNAEHCPIYCSCDAYHVKQAVIHAQKVNFWANCHLPTLLQDWSVMSLTKYNLGTCKDLNFDVEEHHKSGVTVFFEVCIAFVVVGIVALVGYWAYGKFQENQRGRSTNYRHVSMHTDSTTIPYDSRNEDVFSIGDPQASPTGPSPVLAIQ